VNDDDSVARNKKDLPLRDVYAAALIARSVVALGTTRLLRPTCGRSRRDVFFPRRGIRATTQLSIAPGRNGAARIARQRFHTK
jgi:hypothetical protein